ncbi:MAG TPA: luciferase family protein [Rubrobacteraceae bacterium]|nr:luciferase family protein [Rubrobacteraceae bacterium]
MPRLIWSGRAIHHPAFPNSRTTASYQIRTPEDVPGAIELFRMSYERVKAVPNGGTSGITGRQRE